MLNVKLVISTIAYISCLFSVVPRVFEGGAKGINFSLPVKKKAE